MRPPVALLLASLIAFGCQGTPSDLREWRASDHDQPDEPPPGQAAPTRPANTAMSEIARSLGVDEVVLATWQQRCTRCHGTLGRGDGPEGPMVGTRDLSDPAWQAATGDQAIAASIRAGRGKMPAFELPAATLAGLVRLVRMMSDAPAPSAASAPSAPSAPSARAPSAPSARAPSPHPSRSLPNLEPR
ncbi:MAG: cytochrome c [Sorangiineae bacterium]|nr:cytochrome c [Polyangiaceae bacterium]MEB2322275.1 cytochrome c [Sorangiineae bacterium]